MHFLGLAAVIGTFLFQVRRAERFETRWMIIGLVTQLVTGLALMGIYDATSGGQANHVKLGVKLLIALIALASAFVAATRERRARAGTVGPKAALPFFHTAGGLAIVNVFIAVLWR